MSTRIVFLSGKGFSATCSGALSTIGVLSLRGDVYPFKTLLTNSTENRKGIKLRAELGQQGQMPTERKGNDGLCHEGDA